MVISSDGPPQPAWVLDLRSEVERAFIRTGAGTPEWPDPYPDRDPPDSAYSVCDDPGRYRILETRADAWAEVLEAHDIASAFELDPHMVGPTMSGQPVHRARRLVPARPGALSVVLASTLVDGSPFGVEIGVAAGPGDTGVHLEMAPDCGCDACDSGSDRLLAVLDELVMTAARGGVLHVRRGSASATRTWDGCSATWEGTDTWLRQPPPDAEVWRGEPWR